MLPSLNPFLKRYAVQSLTNTTTFIVKLEVLKKICAQAHLDTSLQGRQVTEDEFTEK